MKWYDSTFGGLRFMQHSKHVCRNKYNASKETKKRGGILVKNYKVAINIRRTYLTWLGAVSKRRFLKNDNDI